MLSDNFIKKISFALLRIFCNLYCEKNLKQTAMEPIILNKKFEGPVLNFQDLQNKPGVYVVICDAFGMTPFRVLNAGAAEDVKEKLNTKKKKNFLKKSNEKNLKYLIRYEKNIDERINLVKEIKKQIHPAI